MAEKRRWFRLSLRTLLILFTGAAIVIGWFAAKSQQRLAALHAIREAGGELRMGGREPSRLAQLFGEDAFRDVIKVDLRGRVVDDELLEHVAVLTELRRLDLSGAGIGDQGLRRVSHLPLLELWLQEAEITDASAAILSKMKTLMFLQLNATSISDDFLAGLEALPALNDLGLRGANVTSNGMAYLARHPKLEHLDVYRTEVDDSGVESLVQCQSLSDVGLSSTQVTDEVFEHLAKLPNLTDADLSGNRDVSTEAVLEFEKFHPSCDIEWYRD